MADPQPKDRTDAEILELLAGYIKQLSNRKLQELVPIMGNLGREMVSSDRCTLWLLDEDANELYTHFAHGVPPLRMSAGAGLAGECVRTNQDIRIDDPYADSRFNREMDQKTGYRTQSILVTPIQNAEGKVVGAFQAVNKLAGKFSARDQNLLHIASVYCASTLQSAMLLDELEGTQREFLFRFGMAGEARSKETGNHVKRVGEYCAILARYYGIPKGDVELIRLTSTLHDLGKVAIPDSILKKPGRLTNEEFEVMKMHTVYGFSILNGSRRRMVQSAAEIAYTHQEKFNGTGYPRALKGEEIPIFGRICAVADVFDALSNDRCYKKAWPIDKVLQLFREERGQHFDPALVDILLAHVDEFLEINDRLRDEFLDQEGDSLEEIRNFLNSGVVQ